MFQRDHNYFFIPEIIAFFIIMPLAWWVTDRTPPLILFDGKIEPYYVHRSETVQVTWRAQFSGRDCGGLSQREMVDSGRGLYPQLARDRKGVFVPGDSNSNIGSVQTPPLVIPDGMAYGTASYKVTQFYYCNWLQRFFHWPIVTTLYQFLSIRCR